jgi:hypothetical protein
MSDSISTQYPCPSCKTKAKIVDYRHGDFLAEPGQLDNAVLRVKGRLFCCTCGSEFDRELTIPEEVAELTLEFLQEHNCRVDMLAPEHVWLSHRSPAVLIHINWLPHFKQGVKPEYIPIIRFNRELEVPQPEIIESIFVTLSHKGFGVSPLVVPSFIRAEDKSKSTQFVELGRLTDSSNQHFPGDPNRVSVVVSWKRRRRSVQRA